MFRARAKLAGQGLRPRTPTSSSRRFAPLGESPLRAEPTVRPPPDLTPTLRRSQALHLSRRAKMPRRPRPAENDLTSARLRPDLASALPVLSPLSGPRRAPASRTTVRHARSATSRRRLAAADPSRVLAHAVINLRSAEVEHLTPLKRQQLNGINDSARLPLYVSLQLACCQRVAQLFENRSLYRRRPPSFLAQSGGPRHDLSRLETLIY
jgi:hypothetical protein